MEEELAIEEELDVEEELHHILFHKLQFSVVYGRGEGALL
jgi:hypothetical protein